jgi:hypothetical protein
VRFRSSRARATTAALAASMLALTLAAQPSAAALTPAQLASVAAQTTDAAPSTASPSFFKTGKGVAVLVLVVAGVGYASYSAVHDRNPVKSPIR